jgi:hypothetical protein
MEPETLARKLGVDPKTVQRWLGGRLPHPRHRWKVCDVLGQSEQYLWPTVLAGASGVLHTAEIIAAYAHRADVPSQLWTGMLEGARRNIDLLGYSMSFFPEQHPRLSRILEEKCASGLKVRITLVDPDSAEVAARDELERLGGTLRTGFGPRSFSLNPCSRILVWKYVFMEFRYTMLSTGLMIKCS